MVVHLEISRSSIGIYHSEIGLDSHRSFVLLKQLFEIGDTGANTEGLEHKFSLPVHLLSRYIIVFYIVRSCIHNTETGSVGAGPNLTALSIGIYQSYETVNRSAKPLHPVVKLAGIPVLQHQRPSISAFLP